MMQYWLNDTKTAAERNRSLIHQSVDVLGFAFLPCLLTRGDGSLRAFASGLPTSTGPIHWSTVPFGRTEKIEQRASEAAACAAAGFAR